MKDAVRTIVIVASLFGLATLAPEPGWADPAGAPPAPFQSKKKKKSSPPPPARSQGQGRQCGSKRTCGEMDSCAEAQFYLRQCGVHRLDGDSDGTPCEKLCG